MVTITDDNSQGVLLNIKYILIKSLNLMSINYILVYKVK